MPNYPKICRICGIKLSEINWYPSNKKNYNYICNKCHRLEAKIWSNNNKERYKFIKSQWKKENKEYIKQIYRNHVLGTTINGVEKHIHDIIKRERPESCELCGKNKKFLAYHHWAIIDKKVYGIWVCGHCHSFITVYEKGLAQKYLNLKEEITYRMDENIELLPIVKRSWKNA